MPPPPGPRPMPPMPQRPDATSAQTPPGQPSPLPGMAGAPAQPQSSIPISYFGDSKPSEAPPQPSDVPPQLNKEFERQMKPPEDDPNSPPGIKLNTFQKIARGILSMSRFAPEATQIVAPNQSARQQAFLLGQQTKQQQAKIEQEEALAKKAQADADLAAQKAQFGDKKFKIIKTANGQTAVMNTETGELTTSPQGVKEKIDELVAAGYTLEEAKQAAINPAGFGKAPPRPLEGEMPLGDRVPQLNQMLSQRYQVLNPGAPLPAAYKLPDNATQKDYDRIEKSLSGEESARGTQAQRATMEEMRRQTQALAQSAFADRQAARDDKQVKEGQKPVLGTEPGTGKTILVPSATAKQMGLTDVMDAPSSDISKSLSARQWIPLAAASGTSPDSMGLLQLVNELDKRGALGPIASRWNDFLVGRLGTGTGDPATDQLMEAFRTKLGLSQTLLMNLHVGSRGGAYMLEHFEDLANGKKLDPNILRTGIQTELNYAQDRAMMPTPKGQQKPQGGGNQKTYTQADVAAAVQAHPGLTPQQAEAAFVSKGWVKK